MKLENKVAVITGAAMGNGLGILKVFLKYGAKVIVLDYAKEVLELEKEYDNVKGYLVDIRDYQKVKEAIEEGVKVFGKIDILVNNAGVSRVVPFLECDEKMRDFHFDINISGCWNVTQVVVPYLLKADKPAIVNLSSVTGPMVADPGEVAYATTKGAVFGFTKGIAAEFAPKIRCNAIMPGYIRTPMVDGMAKDTNQDNPEEVIKGIAAGVPLNRLGSIEEVGELAAFLASEESSYITGQGIVIDGGSTMPETMTMGQ